MCSSDIKLTSTKVEVEVEAELGNLILPRSNEYISPWDNQPSRRLLIVQCITDSQ